MAICQAAGDQGILLDLASDGSGGAIMAWTDTHASNDYNICAQRMSPSGARQWAVEGSAICAAIGNQVMPFAVEDGSGGAVIAWSDNRTGELDIYAQRVTCSGTPLWTEDGLAVCTARGNETCNTLMPALGAPLASDDQGGAIIAWTDYRSGSHCDIYAQRVSAGGGLGAPPNPPVNEAPGNGVLDLSVTPTLESSAFDDPDSKDSHAASQWRISGTAGDYSSAIFDSGADSVNLTQIAMPSNKLNGNTTYYWQVRHQDSQRLWSAWSAETSFTTRNRAPNAPITASPASSALEVSVTATLRSSPFSDPDTGDPHAASQWRITATAGDYSNPVFDSNTDNVCLTQMAIPPGKLTGNATYYWQVRHQDSHGVWSEWSAQTSFSTKNQVPNRPSGTSPTPGTTGVSLTPTLAAPLFSDPDTGDTHAASQWRIMATAGDYSSPVFESGTDTANLGELTVPSGALKNSTTYYWQVRHQDNHGDWSDWSEESAFTTQRGSRTWIWIVIGVAAAAAILGVGIGTWRLRSRNKAGPSPS